MEKINLGPRKGIPVVSQKHARLRHKLSGADIQKVLSKEYSHESYRLLCVLIPAIEKGVRQQDGSDSFLIEPYPEWMYDGFNSEEAWKNDEWDETNDPSPEAVQIVEAFEAALRVNGAGRLGKIVELVQMGFKASEAARAQQMDILPGSLGESGE